MAINCKTHEFIKPIRWLIGRWKSVEVKISFPGLESADYTDDLHIINGDLSPTLNYSAKTRHTIKERIVHETRGFIRLKENTNHAYLYNTQSKGVISIEHGLIDGRTVHFKTEKVCATPLYKGNKILSMERIFKFRGKRLNLIFAIETIGEPLTEYLNVTYERYTCDE